MIFGRSHKFQDHSQKVESFQFHNFSEHFADVQTIRLEQNYRSTKNILDAANGLIQKNIDRLGKELWSAGGECEPIKVYAGFNDLDEARFIVERIEQWLESGGDRVVPGGVARVTGGRGADCGLTRRVF